MIAPFLCRVAMSFKEKTADERGFERIISKIICERKNRERQRKFINRAQDILK